MKLLLYYPVSDGSYAQACLTNHLGISPIVQALEQEVENLHMSIKWLESPPCLERAAAVVLCIKSFAKWQQLCTPGTRIIISGENLHVDGYVARKMSETLHILRAHEHVAKIWAISEPGDVSGMQLREVIKEADKNNDGEIDPEEFEVMLDMLLTLLLPLSDDVDDVGDVAVNQLIVEFKTTALAEFSDIDVDGNHMLDAQEMILLTQWVLSHVEALQKEKAFRRLSRGQLNKQMRKIMCGGLTVVGLMCESNPPTQREAAGSLQHFMAHASEPEMQVANFISKMVKDSHYVINRFDLRGIKGIAHLMSQNHDPAWLKGLRHLSAPEGLPQPKTVNEIVSTLIDTLRPMGDHFADPERIDSRSSIEVEWHCEFVLLLAAMVDGGSSTHLLFVHNLISLDQCLQRICTSPCTDTGLGDLFSEKEASDKSDEDPTSNLPPLFVRTASQELLSLREEDLACVLPADTLKKGNETLPAGDRI